MKASLNWARKLITPIETKHFELIFEMDTDPSEQHRVRVFKVVDAEKHLVKHPFDLLNYGYQEIITNGSKETIYTVSSEDTQTLLAMRAHNPSHSETGELIFDVMPHTLKYLRKKNNVAEGAGSREIKILEEPLKPIANVSYNPFEGIKVEAGYVTGEDGEKVVPLEDVRTRAKNGYVRMGKIFTPVEEISEKLDDLMRKAKTGISHNNIPEFIVRDLVLIQKECNAVVTDFVKKIYVSNENTRPVVKVDKAAGGWLDFQVNYRVGDFEVPHDVLKQHLGETYFQVDDFTWVKVDKQQIEETEKKLAKIKSENSENGYRVPAYEFLTIEEFIQSIGGSAVLSDAYKDFLDQLTGFKADPNFQLGAPFEAHLAKNHLQLRPYQRAGIHWLNWLHANHLQGLLADDMGLGKTLQTLCALRLAYEASESQQHSLVVAPKSVLHHWERELNRCFPSMRSYVYHGSNRSDAPLKSKKPHVIITTYDLIARDLGMLIRIPFLYLIIDEATKIKNPDAQRTQAIKALNAMHRLAVSGTPVENRPSELWSLYDFLMRGHLGKYGTFIRQFEEQIMNGNQQAAERLGRRIKPFLLRRKKEDVAKDLPEKLEMTDWVELTPEQADLYSGLQNRVRSVRASLQRGETVNYTANILPLLTKLKQICDHPALITKDVSKIYNRSEKFDWIIAKLDEIIASGEQVVLFSHFLNMLDLFEIALQERNVPFMRIDGSTDNRQKNIDDFNNGIHRVALLSLMAAGHGITLTAANHVIHADRWWNPAIEDQATDRVHRIGQDKKVYVYNVIVQDTLEERIEQLLVSKRNMADHIIHAATAGERSWSKEEILELLKPFD